MDSSSRTTQLRETQLISYRNQLKSDIRSMLVNFEEILKLACDNESPSQVSKSTQCEKDALELQVRAGNIVRAGESLIKMVKDLKEFYIFYNYASIDEDIRRNSELCIATQGEYDEKIAKVADEMEEDLSDLEEEYYNSSYK
ncbi:mediator of RNA polymerase II transcription subunit 22 [Drosophila ficusphila]|uniref:mediator of RNA polymerase II transcription subunit 22 n=1 Tax=Drosophila ficusphila TaxID=30025 RepID=UPI0007E5DFF0|nr:mediator of RNA polymerase II transcription subunit 22 [Drosophila ficusphila]XP_017044032.1 mediator of RNA polymerase II transcription subunit 22 [Drosophila ficusphila]XP_017044033.1 mediator of RNA polymerase II transcription subunit 22 [Drosophila ficusphila]